MSRPIAPLRPSALILKGHGRMIVGQILSGARSHKDLKMAFDWENTPEGHGYWSRARQAAELSREARQKLVRALAAASGITTDELERAFA